MGKIKAIENYENICFCCLQEKPRLNKFKIYGRGYGSSFDNNNTYLQICEDCKPEGIEDWFNEEPEITNGYCEEYKYEDNIFEFVNTFPLQGQELFYNRLSSDGWGMNSQDWIDMKLGILPDEIYEEYGMYSPRQIKAYQERFSSCEYPTNIVWNDNSKGCWCPFGASGKFDQKADEYNYSTECYSCEFYKQRETPLKTFDNDTYEEYEKYIRGKLHISKFKNLFE
jgi:hypothetical protein